MPPFLIECAHRFSAAWMRLAALVLGLHVVAILVGDRVRPMVLVLEVAVVACAILAFAVGEMLDRGFIPQAARPRRAAAGERAAGTEALSAASEPAAAGVTDGGAQP